ncbi:uncharacterized protein N7484_009833 [Penicillium longicatenatum]|uniref:uncharacterized protein n=1 Tax=Penicillium longicatenatum TaxID=1561947 RepID=UPI0025487CF1|nr:uncharacterized protein N7484_009833 [Penicillium longicatenatum]KAJ5636520.1 hypothetical protein N7484_009833 [Penicillium longicatenatum]
MSARFQPSQKWSGNFGVNWECANFLTLRSESTSRECLILGAKGDVEREHIRNLKHHSHVPPRTVRSLLWMFGDLRAGRDTTPVDFAHGGYLDCGSFSLSEIASVEKVPDKDGSVIIRTLGIRPVEEITQLCRHCDNVCERYRISLPSSTAQAAQALCSALFTAWELEATITIAPSRCVEVGFSISHNGDPSISTTITFLL